MSVQIEGKTAVSVAEMARMVGLSRARFYQLIGSTFPYPVYDVATRRPFYPEDLQQMCLEVRRRNCGIDGRPVLFYARRREIEATVPRRSRKKVPPTTGQHAELIDGLKSLGLLTVTPGQVAAAIKELYPSGTNGLPQGEVLRSLFLHLRAQGSGG